METKKVNIYPSTPIVSVTPPIRTTVKGATKKIETIRKCIIARAKVEEVLPTGDTVILDLSNYDKDNRFNTESKMDIPETPADPIVPDAPVVEEPVKEEEPAKEEETVVEEAPVVDESVKEEEPAKEEDTVVKEAPVDETPAEDAEAADTEETVEEDAEEEEVEAPDVDEINAALDDIDTSDIVDEDDGLSDDEKGL